jgi:hypothetical protein
MAYRRIAVAVCVVLFAGACTSDDTSSGPDGISDDAAEATFQTATAATMITVTGTEE